MAVQVHTAQLAGSTSNDDRVFATDHAVILLDGASAFVPVDVDPGTYADTLGAALAERLTTEPEIPLPDAVADAIAHTARTLDIHGEASPSSTVAILRTRPVATDLYVLGDSPIYYGNGDQCRRLTDHRLAELPIPEREKYRAALLAGHGYDDEHHATLAALQHSQRTHRNTEGGYWIAATDPEAGHHGISTTIPASQTGWAILATDGAADPIEHAGYPTWPQIAQYREVDLTALLRDLHQWESTADPDGRQMPRAKRHDDKTIATVCELV